MLPGTRLARERGVGVLEQLWLRPSLSVAAIEAHPLHGSANQILDSARARLSLRTVPRMDAEHAGRKLVAALECRAPAGARVEARIVGTPCRGASRIDAAALESAARALDEWLGTVGRSRLRRRTASGR
jgi:acetylornithine deacetylase/succinyl-diaminopimelate desuccinylase-like protein